MSWDFRMETQNFRHISVLLNECMEGLAIRPDGIYVDGTAGGAGHSSEIAKQLTTGRLIALDKDPDAVITASGRLSALIWEYPRFSSIHPNAVFPICMMPHWTCG